MTADIDAFSFISASGFVYLKLTTSRIVPTEESTDTRIALADNGVPGTYLITSRKSFNMK